MSPSKQRSTHGSSPEGEEPLPELNQDEVRRYSRHLILPDVGVKGQRRLKASSVLAVGTGGLGSPALLYLAAAGVGRLGIVDDDVVDESNLQRQVIHGTATLGKPKVDSARDRMLDVNPHIKVETFHEQLTSENALRICGGYDVVLDGSDNFPTKYLVNDACEILGIPNVYGAILGFEGQMSVFTYKGGPTYRDLLPTPPPPGLVPSCAEGGVLGILPGVVGCIQATEVIKILLGKGDVLSGRLLVYDALKMSFKESDLRKTPGRPAVTSLVDYQGFCGFSAATTTSTSAATPAAQEEEEEEEEEVEEGFQRVSPKEVVSRMQGGWAPFVLDVRLPQEAEIASLPFVDLVCPHRKVATILDQLPSEGDLLVHCKVGGRSSKACGTLSEHGVSSSRLFNMDGGIIRWAKEVDSSLAVY
ncbi:molybdopterin biosynthesis protein MoeB [Ectocarpus siliculosus]|uniref:Molybdopterin biosynthesis protein MoeB n=1 Tax=Ectocarpus siliculosus TaxID=2880 RepID=D7FVG1_ECTSI|nr:molybdopterin biosynthesis protein MoeB [Ectocarpus siliculosus]|eukprot:CBJ31882.1 molybdopterin biosynthesis protein MoeB [Ectocarpus siliculosus]